MPRVKELSGQKFGRLSIVSRDYSKSGRVFWFCICDCIPGKILERSISSKSFHDGTQSCGCLKKEATIGRNKLSGTNITQKNQIKRNNQIGKIYYGCKILDVWSDNHLSYVRALCKCGTEFKCALSNLKGGNTKSCGCYDRETSSISGKNNSLGLGTANFNTLYGKYKSKAIKRGYSFTLSKEFCFKMFQENCYFCGKLPLQSYKQKGCTGEFLYNGLDRVDNSLGYLESNIVTCCWKCNAIKHSVSVKIARKMIEFIDSKKEE